VDDATADPFAANVATNAASAVAQHSPWAAFVSPFELGILVLSMIGATILWAVRKKNGVEHGNGRWFMDALAVGTLLVLVSIAAWAVFGDVYGLGPVAKANFLVVGVAFVNSVWTFARNLWQSTQPPGSGGNGAG
jgi:hypothetical protein